MQIDYIEIKQLFDLNLLQNILIGYPTIWYEFIYYFIYWNYEMLPRKLFVKKFSHASTLHEN